MKWIYALVTGVFTITGILIMILGYFGHITSDPSGWIDPNLEMKLLGISFIVLPWIAIFILEMKFRRDRMFTRAILDSGVECRAVLQDYRETGTYVNESPKLKMTFQFTEEDGSTRLMEVTGVVDLIHAVKLQRGMEVVLHRSERGVVVHWDRSIGEV